MSKRMPKTRAERVGLVLLAAALVLFVVLPGAWSQLAVRPEDPLGVSIRENRVRVRHSTTPEVPGTSMHLQQFDPWLAYQRGRSYFFREWGAEDGVFHALPRRPQAAATTSCGMCHNLPFGGAGAGGNVSSTVGVGRNAPHLYGAGLLETLAVQIRAQVLAAHDDNRNGFLDVPAETRGRRMVVEAAPGVEVDYGPLEDLDGSGLPDLNSAVLVSVVDESGRRVILTSEGTRARLNDPGIVGFDFAIGAFASSAGDHMFPALRVFAMGVLNNIMGILPDVPVQPAGTRPGYYWWNGWGTFTNAGAMQTHLMLTSDPSAVGPSRRGTISNGELDLFEWYMANHPSPALGQQDDQTRRGRALMDDMGCTTCHIADWTILPADEEKGLPGDRRFFDLEVSHNTSTRRLEGSLRSLSRETRMPDGTTLQVPRREGFVVENVFTDLRHYYLGERFNEYLYRDGKVRAVKSFRTAPLWGIGSTAPYGHDGLSPTLDDVIRRHGGDAEASSRAYVEASEKDREAVVAFLSSLVLYLPQELPTDLDGDGKIADAYRIDGRDMGPERFNPELLFRHPPRYRGWTAGPYGDRYFSYALLNVAEAYGETLPALVDRDGDMLPDLFDAETGPKLVGEAPSDDKEPASSRLKKPIRERTP